MLISASVLLGNDGQEAGMVGFATDLRDAQARGGRASQGARRIGEAGRGAHHRAEGRAGAAALSHDRHAGDRLHQPGEDYTCTFVSENVSRIMGFSAWEMLEDKDFWSVRLHPEDAKRVFEEMAPLIETGRRVPRVPLPPP